MRVIMLSTDRNVFSPDSQMAKRMISYGETFGELHVIVFSLKTLGHTTMNLSPKVFVYPTSSSNKLMYIWDTLKIASQISRMLYFGQTVITTQDPFEKGIVGLLLKWKTKFPLQMQIHTDLFSKKFYDGELLNWLRFQIAKFTLKKADGIRVVRQKIKEDLVRYLYINPKKIVVLPIFVDITSLREKESAVVLKTKYPEFSEHIIMVSRLTEEKRVADGIRVFAQVLKHIPDIGLVIVGTGPLEHGLLRLVKSLGIENSVRFEGWQADTVSYYKTADLFLNTSQFEGYGLSLVEAASVGCPIVTTNVGLAEDVFVNGQGALVCEVGDEECLVNHIITLFTNPHIRKTISDSAYSSASEMVTTEGEYLMQYRASLESLLAIHS